MLLVDARVGPSQIHGLGLIAREYIPEGSKIWVLNPEFDRLLTEAELQKLSPVSRRQVKYYAYFCRSHRKYILSADDDRFTNHSDSPNTRDFGEYAIATKNIRPGEEITANYLELGITEFMGGKEKTA